MAAPAETYAEDIVEEDPHEKRFTQLMQAYNMIQAKNPSQGRAIADAILVHLDVNKEVKSG